MFVMIIEGQRSGRTWSSVAVLTQEIKNHRSSFATLENNKKRLHFEEFDMR